jgi:hypothetical protein
MSKMADTIDEIFEDIWQRRQQAAPTDPLAQYCLYSRAYWRYADDVLNRYVRGATDLMRLAQAKVLITERYLEARAYATREHRDKLGSKGHICLYQVWLTSMHEVMATQLTLDPPKVLRVVTQKQESKPPDSLAVIKPALFLGEWKE